MLRRVLIVAGFIAIAEVRPSLLIYLCERGGEWVSIVMQDSTWLQHYPLGRAIEMTLSNATCKHTQAFMAPAVHVPMRAATGTARCSLTLRMALPPNWVEAADPASGTYVCIHECMRA